MNPDNKGRSALVSVITTPLGFFALSLLIVEGFIGIILIGSSVGGVKNPNALDGTQKFWGMVIGAVLFLLVVIIVSVLVWRKPENLTFGEHSYLEKQKMLGDPTNELTKKELQAEPKVEGGKKEKMIILVSYTLSSDKDYSLLYSAIKASPATTWWHYLDSTWLVKTTESTATMNTRLKPYIDGVKDSLLVMEVDVKSATGWLPQKAWDWINTNS